MKGASAALKWGRQKPKGMWHQQHLCVVAGGGEVLANHVLINKALAVLPSFCWAIEGVPQVHAVILCAALQLLTHENVLLRLVGKQQVHLRPVVWMLQNVLHNLRQ